MGTALGLAGGALEQAWNWDWSLPVRWRAGRAISPHEASGVRHQEADSMLVAKGAHSQLLLQPRGSQHHHLSGPHEISRARTTSSPPPGDGGGWPGE